MALAPNYFKEKYKNLEIEELEKEYCELKKEYEFNNKEEFIKNYLDNLLYTSKNTNNNSKRIALEELLKEKTAKEYSIKPNNFEIKLTDIVDYVSGKEIFWTTVINDFLKKLEGISEDDKITFITELYQDRESFNEFTKEILNNENVKSVYEKYKEIAKKYFAMHHVIG